MHNFYKSSLVFLASIVCVSAYCSSAEKAKAGKKKFVAGVAEAISDSVAPVLSSQVSTSKEEQEWKKKSAAAVQNGEQENISEQDQELLDELFADVKALQYQLRVKLDIDVCDRVIATFKDRIDYGKELALFCPTYQPAEPKVSEVGQSLVRQASKISLSSSLDDIVEAYRDALTFVALDGSANMQDVALETMKINKQCEWLSKQNVQEAFKQFQAMNKKAIKGLERLQQKLNCGSKLAKRHAFIAAMLKKHGITLQQPYSNSDFE